MTVQAPQLPALTGVAPTFVAAGSTDTFPAIPSSQYLLHIKNGNAAICSVVIDDQSTGPAGATTYNPDVTISVPATTGERVLVLNSDRFRDPNGNVNLSFSVTATVTYAIYGPFN